jgi:hypothetical protein
MNESTKAKTSTVVRCSCGKVELLATDAAIATNVCYCDTCQKGSGELAALPNAQPVQDVDGGTAYVLYRADCVTYTKGNEYLVPLKNDGTATSRLYASCCNAAMLMRFDDARHWVCLYRARFGSDAPPIEFRICTKFKAEGVEIPNDVPAYAMYSPGLLAKLMKAKLGMLFRPRSCRSDVAELSGI